MRENESDREKECVRERERRKGREREGVFSPLSRSLITAVLAADSL